jgi:uncharacterized membrane protein YdjX (TVP38/TMEM64 family)
MPDGRRLASEGGGVIIEPAQHPPRIWLRALLLIAIVGGLLLLLYELGWTQLFFDRKRAEHFIRSLGTWGFAGFVLLQIAQVVVAPIPGEVVGLLGGYLYGPFLGSVLSTIGLTLGSLLAFSFTRAFGRPVLERFVDAKAIARFDYLLQHQGSFLVFLLFLVPGFPKDYLCYILGLGHLGFARFTLVVTTGRLLGTLMLTFGGAFLRAGDWGKLFALAGAAIVVTFVALAYKDRLERWFRSLG